MVSQRRDGMRVGRIAAANAPQSDEAGIGALPVPDLRYRCTTTGRIHAGLPDVVFRAPKAYYAISEPERRHRALLSETGCVIDEARFFIACRLQMPIIAEAASFAWRVWAEVAEGDFWDWWEASHGYVANSDETIVATLANDLRAGEGSPSLGLAGQILTSATDASGLPAFELLAGPFRLQIQQRHGLTRDDAVAHARVAGARLVLDQP